MWEGNTASVHDWMAHLPFYIPKPHSIPVAIIGLEVDNKSKCLFLTSLNVIGFVYMQDCQFYPCKASGKKIYQPCLEALYWAGLLFLN